MQGTELVSRAPWLSPPSRSEGSPTVTVSYARERQSQSTCKHAHQNVMESPRAEGNGTAKFEISRALVFKFHTISKFTRLKYFTRAKIPTNLSTRSTFLVRTHCSKLNFRVITKAIIIILSSFLMFLAQFYSSPQLDY